MELLCYLSRYFLDTLAVALPVDDKIATTLSYFYFNATCFFFLSLCLPSSFALVVYSHCR